MAEAPGNAGLDQLILDHLMTAATPQRAIDVARACSVTKQEANRVLYKLCKEGKAEKQNDKWVVCADGKDTERPRETTKLKSDDTALVPLPQHVTAVTEDTGLTEIQERIYKLLSENGAHRALNIAKQVGKQTRRDVNADLYALKEKGLLRLEESTMLWSVCGPGTGCKVTSSGPNWTSGQVIIQNNPTNIIYQTGMQNTVSVADSKVTQVGNYNSLNLVDKIDDYGPRAPSFEAASENVDMLHCEANTKATTRGDQEINITESTLMNTVIGNDNKMNIVVKDVTDRPEEHLDQDGVLEKTPLRDFCASARLSLEIVSTPCGEGRAPLQRVNIDRSELSNVVIGNNNQMSVRKQGDSDSLLDESTSEDDDGSGSNPTSEQSAWTSCDESSLGEPYNISVLCEKLNDVIIGSNNYMNVVEIADTESDGGHEEE